MVSACILKAYAHSLAWLSLTKRSIWVDIQYFVVSSITAIVVSKKIIKDYLLLNLGVPVQYYLYFGHHFMIPIRSRLVHIFSIEYKKGSTYTQSPLTSLLAGPCYVSKKKKSEEISRKKKKKWHNMEIGTEVFY